jgi:hypothetical protein
MVDHDPKDDAHRTSNYNEIKSRINKVTEVIVDLSSVGVSPETVQKVLTCLETSKDFFLFGNKSYVAFVPKHLYSYQNGVITKYEDARQMLNVIKLVMLAHTNVYVTDFGIDKLLEEGHERLY